jgi:ketosteroid isomerase-like protein
VATGKEAIEKVVKATCSGVKPSLKEVSSEPRWVGRDYIINVGMWDAAGTGADGKPTKVRIRTSELLHRSGGKWRYVVDHASVGMAPAVNAAAK